MFPPPTSSRTAACWYCGRTAWRSPWTAGSAGTSRSRSRSTSPGSPTSCTTRRSRRARAPGVVRLGAVFVQRPETLLEAGDAGAPLRLELDDTGGAGPARITGTRAALQLRHVTVVARGLGEVSGVAAGLRYLHQSDVRLEDVTLDGLGGAGRHGVPALRTDGGGQLRLQGVRLVGQGRRRGDRGRRGPEDPRDSPPWDSPVTPSPSPAARAPASPRSTREALGAAGVRLHDTEAVALTDVHVRTAGVALSVDGGRRRRGPRRLPRRRPRRRALRSTGMRSSSTG